MKNIQADIKSGNFKQVYLLYGEEAYLKQQYKQNQRRIDNDRIILFQLGMNRAVQEY